jgi:putative oxidoreductase
MSTAARFTRRLLDSTATIVFLPPLLARIAVGVVFVSTGWGKLHNLDHVVDFFRQLGIPAPELQAPFVASVELLGGISLLLGFATRVMAVPLMGTMVVAIVTAIWPDAEGLVDLLGKVEVLYLIVFAWMAVAGPGAASMDAVLWRGAQTADTHVTPRPAVAAR